MIIVNRFSPLDVEFIDGRHWRLTDHFIYRPDTADVVIVPKGFVTDFASIPQLLWNLLPPIGRYGEAAVVHDYLYQTRRADDRATIAWRLVTRLEADNYLYRGMRDSGVGWATRIVIWFGVRLGGWVPWRRWRVAEATHGR